MVAKWSILAASVQIQKRKLYRQLLSNTQPSEGTLCERSKTCIFSKRAFSAFTVFFDANAKLRTTTASAQMGSLSRLGLKDIEAYLKAVTCYHK